jgi:NAD(P)-dependent dehydrogenase (short-subunit alcohol dehydrogenase family)
MGSISRASDYNFMPVPAYKVSKAALNALTVQYSIAFAERGFTFLAITPGVCIPLLRNDAKSPTWVDVHV